MRHAPGHSHVHLILLNNQAAAYNQENVVLQVCRASWYRWPLTRDIWMSEQKSSQRSVSWVCLRIGSRFDAAFPDFAAYLAISWHDPPVYAPSCSQAHSIRRKPSSSASNVLRSAAHPISATPRPRDMPHKPCETLQLAVHLTRFRIELPKTNSSNIWLCARFEGSNGNRTAVPLPVRVLRSRSKSLDADFRSVCCKESFKSRIRALLAEQTVWTADERTYCL